MNAAPRSRRDRIGVLVVDDSTTMRGMVARLLNAQPDITVVGEAADGLQAVHEVRRLEPAVVTMDVRMPRMDGIEAIRRIMAELPCPIVVVCSTHGDSREMDLTMRAIEAGALELVAKPGADPAEVERFERRLVTSVRLMAGVPVVRRVPASPIARVPCEEVPPSIGVRLPRGATAPRGAPAPRPASSVHPEVVAIAASTGGPPALASILSALPRSFPVPVLIAQHMAPGFGSGLHRWLASVSRMPIHVVTEPTRALAGRVYLPRDGAHLEIETTHWLRAPPAGSGNCPSADRLLGSVALAYGHHALGIVLTGMGDDGAAGLRVLADAGGVAWAQDEATSVVYGMPKAAHENGAAQARIPLDKIPDALLALFAAPPEAPSR